MSKTNNETRPQDINANMVSKTVNRLSIALTFFATLAITAIAMWFVYGSIFGDARAAVVQDMQLVKEQAK